MIPDFLCHKTTVFAGGTTTIKKLDFIMLTILMVTSLIFILLLQGMDWKDVQVFHPKFYMLTSILGGIAFILLLIWLVKSELRATYFLGASPALGIMPKLWNLPFPLQFFHIMLIAALIASWRAHRFSLKKAYSKPVLQIYAAFLAVGALSIIINYLFYSSNWQLKVGLLSLSIQLLFGIYLVLLCTRDVYPIHLQNGLISGFLHSAFLLSIIGLFAILILFCNFLSLKTNGVGDFSLYGLGYFERLKLMFSGPTVAGIFFIIAIIFTINDLQNRSSKFWFYICFLFLQIAPWLVIASGSRACKIAMALVILLIATKKSLRRGFLIVFPSALISLYVGMYYQSLPDIIRNIEYEHKSVIDTNSVNDAPTPNYKGRFFIDKERMNLRRESLAFFVNSPVTIKIIGNGFGVGGFKTSVYPSSHTQILNTLIECGITGLVILFLFVWHNSVPLLVKSLKKNEVDRDYSFVLLNALIALLIFSLVYVIINQATTLVVFAIIILWVTAKSYDQTQHPDLAVGT